jgi:hypothetical protein
MYFPGGNRLASRLPDSTSRANTVDPAAEYPQAPIEISGRFHTVGK